MDEITHTVFQFEGFTLDMMRRLLRAGDQDVELRAKSFDVLLYLVENAGHLNAHDEIIQAVWLISRDPHPESLTRCISDVRQAVSDNGCSDNQDRIMRGYLFASPLAHGIPGGPSIAVLPFVKYGDDAAQDYFCDGISEDHFSSSLLSIEATPLRTKPDLDGLRFLRLTRRLVVSKFGELFVISRDSAFKYKGQSADAVFEPLHYLALIEQKDQRARPAAPLAGWHYQRSS